VIPDGIICQTHSPDDWRLYQYKNGRTERRCLGCQRAKSTYNVWGPRCRRGHLKTPWTWRHYGPKQTGRCLPCQYEDRKRRAQCRSR